MKKYINFINETITQRQEEYLTRIISYLNKNTNYTYGVYDEHLTVNKNNRKYDTVLYLMINLNDDGDNKAIRFNFDQSKLYSIDMWENFEFNDKGSVYNKPSYEMTVQNSVVGVLDDIVAFVEGEFSLNEDTNIEDNIEESPEEEVESDIHNFDNLDLDVFEVVKANVIQLSSNKKSRAMIVSGLGGLGKCFSKGTKIIMGSGNLENVENIKNGDFVMGPDSKLKKVYGTNSGQSEMYEIQQNKGINYTVNKDHILSLKKTDYIKKKNQLLNYPDIVNISIENYMKKNNYWKNSFLGYKVGIDFNEQELDIEPYFLGLWLGDGSQHETTITNVDDDFQKKGQIYENSLFNKMKKINVINNKHIPEIYKYNSKKNRLQLLAGLIDSDGYSNEGTGYVIIQKRKNLIDDIKFLSDSLGFKTKLTEISKSIKNGVYYSLSIYGDTNIIPVKITRKKTNTKRRVNHKMTGFKIIEKPIDDYYGFKVDGELFLLEDGTVVHNTFDVRATLNQFNKKYQYFKGNTTSAGLYELLFRYRKELIVLDDMDDALVDKASRDILKAVLDTGDERIVSRKVKGYYYPDDMTDVEIQDKYINNNKLPNQFAFTGSVIFITNLKEEEIDPVIFTRVVSINVELTQKEIIERIKKKMPKMMPEIPIEQKQETLKLMIDLLDTFEEKAPLNLRSFYHCINFRVSNDFDVNGVKLWKMLVKNFLVRKTKKTEK